MALPPLPYIFSSSVLLLLLGFLVGVIYVLRFKSLALSRLHSIFSSYSTLLFNSVSWFRYTSSYVCYLFHSLSIQFPGLGTFRPVALRAQPVWLYLNLSCSRVFSLLPISGYFSLLLWSSGSLAPLQFDSRPATRRIQTKQIKQG